MINDNKNNLDEIKISKLLFNEIINALKTMFKKVALRHAFTRRIRPNRTS